MSGIFVLMNIIDISAQDTSFANIFYKEFTESTSINSLKKNETDSIAILNLQNAIIMGLRNNPRLKSEKLEINAFQAAALQAGLYPNPSVGIELENILGSGEFGSFDAGENTFSISQDFVLGGRLNKGRKVQLLNSNLAKWNLISERLNLISEIRKSFTLISALQHQNNLNEKLLKISKDFLMNLERRIKAGKVSPAEASRASLISTSLEIQIQSLRMQIISEKAKLKAIIGKPELNFAEVENTCNLKYEIPGIDELADLILKSPNLALYKTEMERVKASVELEKARVIPDLSVSFGIRRLTETSDNVFVLGASIPLPLFNNNRGNIQKALIKEDQTKYDYRSTLNQAEARLKLLYNNIKAFNVMIEKLESESIPKANEAFKIITKGNLVGRFTVLDVLDAQRSLFELESQYVSAVSEYNRNVIELEELTLTKFNFEYKARILNDE